MFSSLHNISIDTLPQRFARFMVRAFSASSYEFKLEKGIIRVTPEKVHEILGVPLGGTSIFDLPERPLDDPFVKEWFKQFDPKPLKEIRACNIAEKLVLTKTVDFLFKVNFLMLFANSFCSMIEKKISMIYAEKIALEDLLKRANAEFPNNEEVIELYEKYRRLFKESVFVKDFQAHIDDFDNNDDDGGGKNDDHGSDNVGKKKESAAKDVVNAKKDGVNAEKDGVNVVQEDEADVNEEPEDILEEETFTQSIEKSIDWVGEESDDSEPRVKDVKMKGVKGNKTVVVSKAKKRMHVSDSSSEEDKSQKPRKFLRRRSNKVLKPKKVIKKNKQVKDVKKQVKDESSSSEDKKPFKNKKRSQHVKDVKKKKKKPT
ncbi:hypothetical protein Tco_0974459 [Tanacetum coccineum]|uniref:Uncharacterized protein n=1 Tax=Tanacetum coccineum TaxID=301880 RepID=A0ABQ5EBT4_9ASTR